tara:strand:+ start:438 stop:827 length:390 start_codon:yes stop_codon:yes gene_type:complete
MATLNIQLRIESNDVFSDQLDLLVSDVITTGNPCIGMSTIAATNVGGDNIIAPNVDSTKYVYIKHTGVDANGAAVTTDLTVEDTDNVRFGKLGPGEFMLVPHSKGAAKGVQLETSSGVIVAEYAYFTKA